jgi:hypothetical protein
VSKQRKQTTVEKIAGDIWGTDFNGGVNFSKGSKIDAAARRIDRAIAAAVRKAKLQWERESAMIHAQNSGAGRRVNAGSGS